jgi:CO/xanthine dehydrogenase Mo-binding subunit
VAIDSVPQGQGHCTATAEIVADIFGLTPEAIRVEPAIDTGKDAWSIAAGNYSSRFAGATADAVHLAATRLRNRLAGIAAAQLNAPAPAAMLRPLGWPPANGSNRPFSVTQLRIRNGSSCPIPAVRNSCPDRLG